MMIKRQVCMIMRQVRVKGHGKWGDDSVAQGNGAFQVPQAS